MTRGAAALAFALAVAAAACGGGSGARSGAGTSGGSAATPATRVPIEDDDNEPEEGVTIISARGRMEPSVIEAGLEPYKEDLGACYTTRVGRRTWLGGSVSIHWDIRRDGTVTAVRLAESNLGAWPIEKCLLETARAAAFGKPIGGDADFSLPLEFSLVRDFPGSSLKGKLEVWDEDRALKAVGGQVVALDACDKAKGVKGPPPEDVTITVYVGPQGKAQSAGFSSPKSVLDDAWAECAEKAAMAWRLPDPRGGVAKLAVRYRAQAHR